ncbi:MAG: sigma-70 family RNA polymerase sigma factor [Cyanophyceae cyanobacterium]
MLTNDQARITDRELVLQCQQGDRAAFRQLYCRYQPRVRATLYQLCGERVLDDLIQEVFLRAWKGLPKLREAAYFSTWIYRITWNVASEHRRYSAQTQRRSQEYRQTTAQTFQSLVRNAPDLMQLHYQDLVQRGLQSLSFEHRTVIVLHDLEDLPQREVAQILRLPLGTVKSRLFHARKAIRQFLQQQGVSL